MRIEIAQRLKPFSHRPGTRCVIPGTCYSVEIFPALLRFDDTQTYALGIRGPVAGFTIQVDLEKQRIAVYGASADGFFRYFLTKHSQGCELLIDKAAAPIPLTENGKTGNVAEKEKRVFALGASTHAPGVSPERLSLGVHKAQDWDQICRRLDLQEIFPFWLRLGQMTPLPEGASSSVARLEACRRLIAEQARGAVGSEFLSLFQVAFAGILSPQLEDASHLGISFSADSPSSFSLLSQGAHLIRDLFFQERKGRWDFLPCLPSHFAAGRFTDIQTQTGEKISVEWSKYQLQKVVVVGHLEAKVTIGVPKELRSCRLRSSAKDRGCVIAIERGEFSLSLSPKMVLFIDRFEK